MNKHFVYKSEKGWVYELYTQLDVLFFESNEFFEAKAEAEFAAIGHLSRLQQGENDGNGKD